METRGFQTLIACPGDIVYQGRKCSVCSYNLRGLMAIHKQNIQKGGLPELLCNLECDPQNFTAQLWIKMILKTIQNNLYVFR